MGLDLSILCFFNKTIASPSLDPIMVALTTGSTWVPVYLLAIILLLYYKRWAGLRLVISVALLVGVADLATNRIIKPLADRPRPCASAPGGGYVVEWIRLPDGARSGGSFPSSHALNNFAAAAFFISLFYKKKWVWLLIIPAFVIASTRMYLGLHYPSDTAGGIIIGSAFGYLWARLYVVVERRFWGKGRSVFS